MYEGINYASCESVVVTSDYYHKNFQVARSIDKKYDMTTHMH